MPKLFISGSIEIKQIPQVIYKILDNAIANNFQILVGDAAGIDSSIQDYFSSRCYYNVTVYSISRVPRYKANNYFQQKTITVPSYVNGGREAQQEKDKAMTTDAEMNLVIWNGKSKGSYANILRAIDQNKKVATYLVPEQTFISNATRQTVVDKFNSYNNSRNYY